MSESGTEANDHSTAPNLSGDGQWLVFHSEATNLLNNQIDSEDTTDVFMHNLSTGQILKLTGSFDGNAIDKSVRMITMTNDARFMVLRSSAKNLITPAPSGGDYQNHNYLLDRSSGEISLLAGTEDNIGSVPGGHRLSDDGRYLFFLSEQSDVDVTAIPLSEREVLVSGVQGYIQDLMTGELTTAPRANIPIDHPLWRQLVFSSTNIGLLGPGYDTRRTGNDTYMLNPFESQ